MHARAASASTEQSAAGFARTQSCTSRSGSRSADCAASGALNCDWPPGRLTNTTSQRATSSAGLGGRGPPRRRASARSMPGGHAGGGPDVAVAHEDAVRVDLQRGVALGQALGRRPVSGHAAAVEQPGRGQQERAGAHRGHPAGASGGRGRPSAPAPRPGPPRARRRPPATTRVSIAPRQPAGRAVRGHRDPAVGGERPVARRHDLGRVARPGTAARPRRTPRAARRSPATGRRRRPRKTMRRGLAMAR